MLVLGLEPVLEQQLVEELQQEQVLKWLLLAVPGVELMEVVRQQPQLERLAMLIEH